MRGEGHSNVGGQRPGGGRKNQNLLPLQEKRVPPQRDAVARANPVCEDQIDQTVLWAGRGRMSAALSRAICRSAGRFCDSQDGHRAFIRMMSSRDAIAVACPAAVQERWRTMWIGGSRVLSCRGEKPAPSRDAWPCTSWRVRLQY